MTGLTRVEQGRVGLGRVERAGRYRSNQAGRQGGRQDRSNCLPAWVGACLGLEIVCVSRCRAPLLYSPLGATLFPPHSLTQSRLLARSLGRPLQATLAHIAQLSPHATFHTNPGLIFFYSTRIQRPWRRVKALPLHIGFRFCIRQTLGDDGFLALSLSEFHRLVRNSPRTLATAPRPFLIGLNIVLII